MLFSEIYGSYFQTVAQILKAAMEAPVTEKDIRRIVQEKAFGESMLTIPASLLEGKWQLLTPDGRALLKREPSMPLTLLEKRWLKSLLADPRVQLFAPSEEGLEDVAPLFLPQDVVYFDRYLDGDPFTDPSYIEHFRILLTAIRQKRKVALVYLSRHGEEKKALCIPGKLEYSAKDDKFRLLGTTKEYPITVNLARIRSCRYGEPYTDDERPAWQTERAELTLLLTDERNALERCMLHFSDFEKVTEKLDELHYRFLIRYDRADEVEVLIRVMSFGPKLEVEAPESFREKIKERLLRQKSCGK